MKTLIAYFSHNGENYFDGSYKVLKIGNTKRLMTKIKDLINADIFEIETVKTYPETYKACCDEALKEQKNNELPKLKSTIDTSNYDTIILGYPCWWGTMPRAVFSFLSEIDTNNKQILPICTHEGSQMGTSENDLRALCKNAKIKKGLAIKGSFVDNSDEKIVSYLKENNLM